MVIFFAYSIHRSLNLKNVLGRTSTELIENGKQLFHIGFHTQFARVPGIPMDCGRQRCDVKIVLDVHRQGISHAHQEITLALGLCDSKNAELSLNPRRSSSLQLPSR